MTRRDLRFDHRLVGACADDGDVGIDVEIKRGVEAANARGDGDQVSALGQNNAAGAVGAVGLGDGPTQAARVVVVGETRHRKRNQAAVVTLLFSRAERQGGFYASGLVFQSPVATAQCAGGGVGAGGDVASGQGGKVADQLLAAAARSHVAAVNEQIGARAEGTAPRGNFTGACQQAGTGELAAAQEHQAVGAVTYQVQRTDVVALRQQR